MEEWKECKLGDICNISSSKRIFAEEYVSSGIPFYRGKEIIEKHNKNTVSSELFITHERFAEIKSKFPVPQIDDILLTSVGTLGISWLVNESNFYFKDGNLTWFRSNTEKVNPKFLYYWFESNYAKNQIDSMCIGSTQKALTIDTLSKFSKRTTARHMCAALLMDRLFYLTKALWKTFLPFLMMMPSPANCA